ncbi:MAG: hypothetical protein AAF961_02790, partial [Planctomycetota bacterium]
MTQPRRPGAIGLLLVVAVALGGFPAAFGGVVGIGDISPFVDDDGVLVPDLPFFGGEVPDVVVGGTGFLVGGTNAGEMTISVPSDTDPRETNTGEIGGTEAGLGLVRIVSLNSEWRISETLSVGQNGQGFLELIAGAQLVSDQETVLNEPVLEIYVGELEGSQGFVSIDGFASLMSSNVLSVGRRGFGALEIIAGGRMDTRTDAFIGEELDLSGNDNAVGTGTVRLEGRGTRWNVGDTSELTPSQGVLTVGLAGRGTLEIRDQAWTRVNTDTFLGFDADSFGEVIVSDRNSTLWTFENLYVGNTMGTASGVLELIDDGLARADDATIVGPRGLVQLAGGTLLSPTVENNGVIRGAGRVESAVNNFGDLRTASTIDNLREQMWVTGEVSNDGIVESIGGEMEFESLFTNNVDGQIFGKDAILRFRGGLINNGSIVIENTVIVDGVISDGDFSVGAEATSTIVGGMDLGASSTFNVVIG